MTPDQFTATANFFAEATLLLSAEGVVLAANRHCQRLGLPPQTLVGSMLSQWTVNADSDVTSYLRECARSREPMLGALTLRKPDGTQLVCRSDGALVERNSGESSSKLIIKLVPRKESTTTFSALNQKIEELTEEIRRRQRLQKELVSQQESLRVTLASIGDGVIVTNARGAVTFLNPIAEALTGWSNEQAASQPLETVFQILHETTRQPLENPALKALRERRIVGLANHTLLIARDGAARVIDDSAAPIREQDGNVAGVVLVFRDVSQQRKAERRRSARLAVTQILAEERMVERAIEEILAAVCEALEWNVGCYWGVEPGQRTLCCQEMWQSSREWDEFGAISRNARFERGDSLPGRVWNRGRPVWVSDVTAEPGFRRAPQAKKVGLHGAFACPVSLGQQFFGVIECFSREIRQPDDDLLEMMATIGIQIGQFIERRQAEEELCQADRRKDEFLAMLAHELRNPLAPIRSGLDILAMESTGQQNTIKIMKQQVEHLVRLVDDLLDVSRIMRGRIELRRQTVKLASVVNRAVEVTRPAMETRDQELSISLPNEEVQLHADPVRLVQVLENLLNNASKYTDPGGWIEVTADVQDHQLVLRVRDNGVGIESGLLPKVFDLFSQSVRTLDRSQGGLGIGLTLVQNLVRMHGGIITAHSEGVGKGSEFVVRLPISAAQTTSSQRIPQPLMADGSRRILIVDDNVGAAELLSMLLSKLGDNQTEIAYDGESALEKIETFHPEIVLLDIGLPRMDGYQVAKRIRQNAEFDRTLLIALTGYGQAEDRRRSKQAGFDEHLVKPPAMEDIASLLSHPKLVAGQGLADGGDSAKSRIQDAVAGASETPSVRGGRSGDDAVSKDAWAKAMHELGNHAYVVNMAAAMLDSADNLADTIAVRQMLKQLEGSMHKLMDALQS